MKRTSKFESYIIEGLEKAKQIEGWFLIEELPPGDIYQVWATDEETARKIGKQIIKLQGISD